MDNISISAASGMRARMESLEMLANNLANVETGGYKADREFYSLYTSASAGSDSATGAVKTNPVIESHWTDLAQGDFRTTSNPLDLAIDGEGMFAVNTQRGVRYTRNGNFRLDPNGALSAFDGNPLQAKGGGNIVLQPGVPFEVLPGGAVTQSGQTVGQIELVAFDNLSLNKEGANYFSAKPGAVGHPAKGTIAQGQLEQSNVGSAESAVRLVSIMRQFEMLQKAATVANDLNKRAIEEVARVIT